MPRGNLCSALSRRRRARPARDPMAEFDQLPADLRRWLATAALPWSPRSALRVYAAAMRLRPCPVAALARLDAVQAARLARDPVGLAGQIPSGRPPQPSPN